MPTDEQAQACLRVCQMLSNGTRRSIYFGTAETLEEYIS
jgi:hypothetical protein